MRELLTRQSVSRHVDSHVCRDRWSKVRPTRMPHISVDGKPYFVAGIDVGHGAVHVCVLCQAMYIVWMGHGALASGFGGNFPGGDEDLNSTGEGNDLPIQRAVNPRNGGRATQGLVDARPKDVRRQEAVPDRAAPLGNRAVYKFWFAAVGGDLRRRDAAPCRAAPPGNRAVYKFWFAAVGGDLRRHEAIPNRAEPPGRFRPSLLT